MADQTWGAFPVRMSDLSSFQITSRPVGVLDPPVTADVGKEVFGRGLVRGQAGDVEDGLGPGQPLAFLLVRGVALDEDGLLRAGEPGALGGGEDADRIGSTARFLLSGRSFSALPSSEPRGHLSAHVALQ